MHTTRLLQACISTGLTPGAVGIRFVSRRADGGRGLQCNPLPFPSTQALLGLGNVKDGRGWLVAIFETKSTFVRLASAGGLVLRCACVPTRSAQHCRCPIPPSLPQILVITPWLISIFYIVTVVYGLAMEASAGLCSRVGWGAARLPCPALHCSAVHWCAPAPPLPQVVVWDFEWSRKEGKAGQVRGSRAVGAGQAAWLCFLVARAALITDALPHAAAPPILPSLPAAALGVPHRGGAGGGHRRLPPDAPHHCARPQDL